MVVKSSFKLIGLWISAQTILAGCQSQGFGSKVKRTRYEALSPNKDSSRSDGNAKRLGKPTEARDSDGTSSDSIAPHASKPRAVQPRPTRPTIKQPVTNASESDGSVVNGSRDKWVEIAPKGPKRLAFVRIGTKNGLHQALIYKQIWQKGDLFEFTVPSQRGGRRDGKVQYVGVQKFNGLHFELLADGKRSFPGSKIKGKFVEYGKNLECSLFGPIVKWALYLTKEKQLYYFRYHSISDDGNSISLREKGQVFSFPKRYFYGSKRVYVQGKGTKFANLVKKQPLLCIAKRRGLQQPLALTHPSWILGTSELSTSR